MKIIFATSEAVPFAKTGGLGDVSGALPKVLAHLGHDVTLILPKYRQVHEKRFNLLKKELGLKVPIAQKIEEAEIYSVELAPHFVALLVRHDDYYDREQLYGTINGDYEDNAERFIFFSRAVLEAALGLKLEPDIIHCNDWQTGLIPVYLKTLYRNLSGLKQSVSIFTIHNLAYQGLFWQYDLPMTNLGWELFTPKALEFYGKINFLKGGVVFGDAVTTVSRKYMEEIQTEEFGCGLQGVFQERREDLYGILNGVDYKEWSPEVDPFIIKGYHASDLRGKKICKADLQREFRLPQKENVPLIGAISRLAEQKGFDLIAASMPKMVDLGLQFVLLGTGEEKYHLQFQKFREQHPEQIGVKIGFDNALAHKIEAGSDMFIMPSRYEPCGLNQIYSLKYGTVPIVRATGGLDDTIQDFNPPSQEGNGFKFVDYSPSSFLETIHRALQVYRDPISWEKLIQKGMSADFSWEESARGYLKVYQETLAKKKECVEKV
jgi:starch synthase